MDTIPFTNRRSMVKVCVVWILGLAVLLGSSGVSLAQFERFEPNKIYCGCVCANPTGNQKLGWEFGEKGASCALDGKACMSNDFDNINKLNLNKLEGTYSCMECVGNEDGKGGALCTDIRTQDHIQIPPPMRIAPPIPLAPTGQEDKEQSTTPK